MYTLEDYEAAKTNVQRLEDAFDRYTGNNPDKYQAELKSARGMVRLIEADLKGVGILPKTDTERLHDALNKAYPNAESKQIVTYNGKKYQCRYFPLEKSRSRKRVTEWKREWIVLEGKGNE